MIGDETVAAVQVIFCRKEKPKEKAAYEVREPPDWAEAVARFPQRRLDKGEVVVLYGDCPRCGHLMDVELPITLQTGGRKVSAARDDERLGDSAFLKTARCNCQTSHDDRPEDVKDGCGAFGMIEVG
jgi:hypothetical protein